MLVDDSNNMLFNALSSTETATDQSQVSFSPMPAEGYIPARGDVEANRPHLPRAPRPDAVEHCPLGVKQVAVGIDDINTHGD